MDSTPPPTQNRRPLPPRPEFGLVAWQMTMGYISKHHSPDAILKIQAYPDSDGTIRWAASVTWGSQDEAVRDQLSLGAALTNLWHEVEQHHRIFHYPEDAMRRPYGYEETEWLDIATHDVLHRLLWTIQTVYNRDWLLISVYHPTEAPAMRVQARLIAPAANQRIGGRGPSMGDALHDLFRNAAPAFADKTGLDDQM